MAKSWKVKVNNVGPLVHDAAAAALRVGAEHVHGEAVQQTPIEEGTLRDSATVAVDEGALVAAVSYATPYAVVQHEAVEYRHRGGGNAKYLERPAQAAAKTLRAVYAAELRRRLR